MTDTYEPDLTVRMSGGFHGDAVYERMSPIAREVARQADWWDGHRAAIDEREHAERAAAFEEASIRMSVQNAIARGEHVDPRQASEGIGRTHREVLLEASARMDMEDRREAWRRAREGAHLTDQDWSDMHSADVSAPDIYSEAGKAEQARAAEREKERGERERDKSRAWGVARAYVNLREQGLVR